MSVLLQVVHVGANRRYSDVKGIEIQSRMCSKAIVWNLISICRIGWYQELPSRSICYRGRRSGRNWCWASTNATWKIRQQPRLPAVSPSNFPPFVDFSRDYLIKGIQVVEAAAEIPVPSGCVESFTRSDGPFDHSELCVEYESFRAVSYRILRSAIALHAMVDNKKHRKSWAWEEETRRRRRRRRRLRNSFDTTLKTPPSEPMSYPSPCVIDSMKRRFSSCPNIKMLESLTSNNIHELSKISILSRPQRQILPAFETGGPRKLVSKLGSDDASLKGGSIYDYSFQFDKIEKSHAASCIHQIDHLICLKASSSYAAKSIIQVLVSRSAGLFIFVLYTAQRSFLHTHTNSCPVVLLTENSERIVSLITQ